MSSETAGDGESGQATVEWVGLVLVAGLVAATFAALVGTGLPGAALAHAIGSRLICALGLGGDCSIAASPLVAAYGPELGALVALQTPQIRYEPGMRAIPVDYRDCRVDECAEAAERIRVARALGGEPATVFSHVIDCRAGSPTPGANCSGPRAGNRYVQYWLYYPGSATGEGSGPLRGLIRTASEALGSPSYHPDDWESVQFRIGPDGGVDVRASSHRGYGPGWIPAEDAAYRVSGGSHAGTVEPSGFDRLTPKHRLEVIPLEPIAAAHPETAFAVTPPWRKRVWLDPEYEGTD